MPRPIIALIARTKAAFGTEVPGLLAFLLLVVVVFGLTAPKFLSAANFKEAVLFYSAGYAALYVVYALMSYRFSRGRP